MYLHDDSEYFDYSAYAITQPTTIPTPPAPKEVPFYPPVLTLEKDKINIDIVTEDNGYIITNKHSKEDPYTDISVPTIFIDDQVRAETFYIMDHMAKTKEEVAMFYLLNRVSSKYPHYRAYGYFITDQDVTSAEVEADGEDIRRYYTWLQENLPEHFTTNMHRKIMPVHSHHTMGNFWSPTDLKQQNSRGDMGFCDDYKFFGVYTVQNKLKVSLVGYFPIYYRVEDVNVGIKTNKDTTLTHLPLNKERKLELEEICSKLVRKRKFAPAASTSPVTGPYQGWVSPYSPYNVKPVETTTGDSAHTYLTRHRLTTVLELFSTVIKRYIISQKIEATDLPPEKAVVFITDEICDKLFEEYKNLNLTTLEKDKLKTNMRQIVKYAFIVYTDIITFNPDGTMDRPSINLVDAMFNEIYENLLTLLEDDSTPMYALEQTLKKKPTVEEAILVVDKYILDNIVYEKGVDE